MKKMKRMKKMKKERPQTFGSCKALSGLDWAPLGPTVWWQLFGHICSVPTICLSLSNLQLYISPGNPNKVHYWYNLATCFLCVVTDFIYCICPQYIVESYFSGDVRNRSIGTNACHTQTHWRGGLLIYNESMLAALSKMNIFQFKINVFKYACHKHSKWN